MSDLNWILERFQEYQSNECVSYQEDSYTFAEVLTHIEAWKTEIEKLGIQPGACVAIPAIYYPQIICLFWALIFNNNIVMPLVDDAEIDFEDIFAVAETSGQFLFKNHEDWVYREVAPVHPFNNPLLAQLQDKQEAGIVISTSGTSGYGKTAVLRASSQFNKFKGARLRELRTLVFSRLDHIGGMNALTSMMLSGGTIIPCERQTPESVCQTIEKHKAQLIPTTPTFLNMMMFSRAYESYDLSSLKTITYGGEPMQESILTAANKIFSWVTIKQVYGSTELGVLSTKPRSLDSHWIKIDVGETEFKVVDGILWVRSPTSMMGYLNAPSPIDADGWLNTGDMVEVDGEYIRILGRRHELINVGGDKLHPSEVENVIQEMPNIQEVVVRGEKNPVMGQVVTASVSLEDDEDESQLRKRIYHYCQTRLEAYKIPLVIRVSQKSVATSRFKKTRVTVA